MKQYANAANMSQKGVEGEIGRCTCGASYYRAEDIGQPCEIQYCRGTITPVPPKGLEGNLTKYDS
jgi:hypothetical protein